MIKMMLQATIGDYLQPIIDWITFWGYNFCYYCFIMLTNPVIVFLIVLYFLAVFTKWYLKRQAEIKEQEYLTKPSYEEIERRNRELEEELRTFRRKLRQRAFAD